MTEGFDVAIDVNTTKATIKAAIEGSTTNKRYAHAIMGDHLGAAETDTDLKTAFASFESRRVSVCTNYTNCQSASTQGSSTSAASPGRQRCGPRPCRLPRTSAKSSVGG